MKILDQELRNEKLQNALQYVMDIKGYQTPEEISEVSPRSLEVKCISVALMFSRSGVTIRELQDYAGKVISERNSDYKL